MTGSNKEIGQSIIKAVSLAIKDIDNNLIEIYPKDTASRPNQTLKSAFELKQMGIKVIIGPVFYESLTYLNEMKDVSFLSLTNKTLDLPEGTTPCRTRPVRRARRDATTGPRRDATESDATGRATLKRRDRTTRATDDRETRRRIHRAIRGVGDEPERRRGHHGEVARGGAGARALAPRRRHDGRRRGIYGGAVLHEIRRWDAGEGRRAAGAEKGRRGAHRGGENTRRGVSGGLQTGVRARRTIRVRRRGRGVRPTRVDAGR